MSLQNVSRIADKCNHYAMCKIDYLGTGLCPSGKKYRYVSYYPEGRMEIVSALSRNLIPVTKALIDIADSCSLCGICNRQCYFVSELKPLSVMKELKDFTKQHLDSGNPLFEVEENHVLDSLRAVVGDDWATNDPAILITYSKDASPFVDRIMPMYVTLPSTREEVREIIRIASLNGLNYTPRASGSSGHSLAMGEGIIIDFSRMDQITINPENWSATIQPGVFAFNLQKEAVRHGMRANVAEPASCVCSNIITTHLNSLFSHAYGMGADLVIDAEFLEEDGNFIRLSDKNAPNLMWYDKNGVVAPRLCTEMTVKLFPVAEDDGGIFVPFKNLSQAMDMARDIARRRIGMGAGVIDAKYGAFFMSPTKKTSDDMEYVLREKLGIRYLLIVLGDQYALDAVKSMAPATIDREMFRTILYSVPKLYADEGIDLLSEIPANMEPYEILFKSGMESFVEVALAPCLETVVNAVDEEFRDFYRDLYQKPEMTDILWLNMFRITTARIGRGEHYNAIILYFSMNNMELIPEICGELKKIADECGLNNDFGYHNTIDYGKWALLEYDFYHDHTDEEKRKNVKKAIESSYAMIDASYIKPGRIKGIIPPAPLWQGLSRNEYFLYQ